jgi:predicted enzyme related to lactoylglutathione lyase
MNTSIERLSAAGAKVQQPASDVGGGKLVATMQDVDGNVFGLSQTPS